MPNHRKLIASLAVLITLGAFTYVGAAPYYTFQPTLVPQSNNAFDLGTSTQVWRNLYVTRICLSADCQTAWPAGGSGSGAATTSFAATSPIKLTTSASAITYSWIGLATSSQPSSSNILVSNGGAGVYGAATSTLTASSPLTGSFVQIGSAGSLGIQAASASQAGSMAAVDYSRLYTATTTFSSPLTYTNSTNAVTCATCLTGNQTITLSGVVTGSGATAITTAFGSQSAGVLGNSITGNTAPMATSTLYGAASTGGFVLQWSNTTGGLVLAATSSAAGGGVTSVTGTWPIISSGGNTPNITFGWATTTQPASSNLVVSNGTNGFYGVGTSTLTASGPLTGSFTQVGSGGSLGCTTAASGVAGCLSNTAFDTFNNKQAALTATWPQILTGATLTFGGLSTSTAAVVGNIPYYSGVNTFANVATTTHSVSGPFYVTGTMGSLVGGTNSTIVWAGLATTSQPSSSNLLVSNGTNGVFGVATTSETCSSGVSCTAHAVLAGGGAITLSALGSAGVLGAITATTPTVQATSTLYGAVQNGMVLAGLNGSLQYVATTTFNAPLSYSAGAVTLSTVGTWSGNAGTATALAANGTNCSSGYRSTGVDASGNAEGCMLSIATSSAISAASGLLYATGINTFASVATSSAINMSITGNAATVTTNANLSGAVTSSGSNVTSFGSQSAGVLGTAATGVPSMLATSTLFGGTATFLTTGQVGIASTTPFSLFSINPNGITVPAFAIGSTTRTLFAINAAGGIRSIGSQPATSTAITLDWNNTPNLVEYRIGTAATTITLINATTTLNYGSRKLISVWNPNSAGGALTFNGIEFASAYTQTTAANRGDLISCFVSFATSTTAYKVVCTAGAASQ